MDAQDMLTTEELEEVIARRKAKERAAAEPPPTEDDAARAKVIFSRCQEKFNRYNIALHRDIETVVGEEIARGLAAYRKELVGQWERDGFAS